MRPPSFWHLVLLAAFLWGGEYLRRDLWDPDEVRYAYVAREMEEDGHWLVPHRSGEYYAHKPPLLFWLTHLACTLTGLPIGRLTARLPGFFAGLLVLWSTARLARRWAGDPAAWPAVLTLSTTYLFWHEIGFARMDGLLLGWTTAALLLLFFNDDAPSFGRPALAWLCMGLGILTKGPVGLLIPAGAYAAARVAAGESRLLKKSHWLWGPLIALAVPGVWLALAAARGAPPGYFRELLFSQNLERAAGDLGHVQPVYYFLYTAPLDLLPWTLALPAALLLLRQSAPGRRLLRRLGGWIGFILVFFTLSVSKRNIYVLGIFPAVAILIGSVWADLETAGFRWARFARSAFLGVLLVGGAGFLIASFLPRLPVPGGALWPSGLAGLAGAAALARARRRPPGRFFPTAAAAFYAVQWTVGLFIYPAMNPLKTPVGLLPAVAEHLPPGRPLLIYRINGEIFAYYSQRRGRVLRSPEELEQAMEREGRGVAVFLQRDWEPLAGRLSAAGPWQPFRSGSKRLVWLAFGTTPAQTTPAAP